MRRFEVLRGRRWPRAFNRREVRLGAATFVAIVTAGVAWPVVHVGVSDRVAPTSRARDGASGGRAQTSGASFRVIDGDTIENTATSERIRVANVDTAETGDRARCALERRHGDRAKREVRTMIASAEAVSVRRTGRIDNYGRTVAFVLIDGQDLGRSLTEAGLARPWRGRRQPWCAADRALLP